MATFQRRYSDAQDRAIIAAQVDHGLSAVRAVELAAAGTLPGAGGLEAFTMPAATARDKAGVERRRRRTAEIVAGGPSAALENVAAELLALVEHEVKRATKAATRAPIRPGRIVELARAGREVAQLVKVAGGKAPAPAAGTGDGGSPDDGDDFLAGLAGR